jgi:hypothetical protein
MGFWTSSFLSRHPARRARAFGRVGVWAFRGAAFVFGEPAKHASLLTGPHSPLPAGLNDLTLTADGLCVICPVQRGARVPDREEQVGVLVKAGSRVTPRHAWRWLSRGLGDRASCEPAQVGDRWLSRCSSADQFGKAGRCSGVGRVPRAPSFRDAKRHPGHSGGPRPR